jgi:hypothetical protein
VIASANPKLSVRLNREELQVIEKSTISSNAFSRGVFLIGG